MKYRSTTLLLVLAFIVPTAFADTVVLDPGSNSTDSTFIGTNVDRGDAFDALANFSITSAGIFFQPLTDGAKNITVNIYAVTPGGDVGTLGGLLASASFAVADSTSAFHDVPISFDFTSGNRYYLAFTADGSSGWGGGINNMPFFEFNAPTNSPFHVGDVSVVDGGCFPENTCAGFGNFLMPLVRLETTAAPTTSPDTSEVPEPAGISLALAGLGIAAGLWRTRVTRVRK